jgi:hypothetical protein
VTNSRTVRFPKDAMISTHKWRSGRNDKGGWELFLMPRDVPTRLPYFHEANVWVGEGLLVIKVHETYQRDPVTVFRHPRTYEVIAVLAITDLSETNAGHPDYALQLAFALPAHRILLQKRLW